MSKGASLAAHSPMLQRVKNAVAWRSGSQLVAQLIAWGTTFLVIRLLDPADYGLFAMTQVILVLLNVMNGYGMAGALIRAKSVSRRQYAQVLGLLLLMNLTLGATQFALAPLVADYYRQPMVADLLRVQSLLYLATPFLAVPHAILSREMDFKRPAQIRLVAALSGAATALACAWSGFGVWTLVAAPMVIFGVEAIGMTLASRAPIVPIFRFDGMRGFVRFGGTLTLVQFFWFLQSQADILFAGRLLEPHQLGLYSTALFVTMIFASKFVPPLNEVAFAAYSRIPNENGELAEAFLRTVRLILLLALPFHAGLAALASPFVEIVLGPKWLQAASLMPILAIAMSMLTLQVLFAPATNALDRPGIALRAAIAGGLIFPAAFLVGLNWGTTGLAWAWTGAMALLVTTTARLSLPVIGLGFERLAHAIAPPLFAALMMALMVRMADNWLEGMDAVLRLSLLVPTGAALYGASLAVVAPSRLAEAWRLVSDRGDLRA